MELKVPLSELRKRSLLIGVPCYGGMAHGIFMQSALALKEMAARQDINIQFQFLFNESLIPRARNYLSDLFLQSNFTHFMFIDSDISFNPMDVIVLLGMMAEDSPYDVLGAVYPKKSISWEKVKVAVDKGFADENPNDLEKFIGDFVFNPAPGKKILLGEPGEVSELGTGFMMIRRQTFEKFKEAYPEKMYKPDHARTTNFDGSREIAAFFDCVIDPKSKRYLSEDYYFCQKVREAGMKVWACPWMDLTHAGTYHFKGSLAAISAAGVSPTVGKEYEKVKKKKGGL